MEKTVWSADEVEGNEAVIIYFNNGRSVRGRVDGIEFVRPWSTLTGDEIKDLLRTGKTIVNTDAVSFAHIWRETSDDDM